jgi:tetratricopeptide (TPR) repeat protein
MKFVSTMALGLALALGVSTVAIQPAIAAKKQKAAPMKLSEAVRAALAPAQQAIDKGDFASALPQLAAAEAGIKSDDDRYYVGQLYYQLGQKTNNTATLSKGLDLMASSASAPAEQRPVLLLAQGQAAYQAKQYAKAEHALQQAIQLNPNNLDAYAMLAEAKHQNKKSAEAVAVLEQVIAKQKAAGQNVPAQWYQRGVGIAFGAKLPAETERLTQSWLAAYPSKSNWRDSLITYRDLNRPDADYQLDIMRLMRATGALNGERDYAEYIEATYVKFPGEAKSVYDEGVAAGMIKAAGTKEMGGIASGKIGSDKASLAASAKTARAAANGRAALNTADAYASYKDWVTAIDLYKVALQKGGIDANVVNTRLAFALAQSGQKDAAKQVLASITGPRASLAKYMTLWLNQPA